MRKTQRQNWKFTVALPLCAALTACVAKPAMSPVLPPMEAKISASSAGLPLKEGQTASMSGQVGQSGQAARHAAGGLSLEESVDRALAWHPSIDEAVGRLNQRNSDIEVARAGYRPKVSGGVRSLYGGEEKRMSPELNVSASQMVFDFGKVNHTVEATLAGVEVRHSQLLMTIDTVIRDTAYAYIETQRNVALLQAARAQAAGIGEIASLVRQRSQKGASTRSDEVQADAREQAAETRVIEIASQLNRWQITLASLMGKSGIVEVGTGAPSWLLKACEAGDPDWSRVPAALRAEAERKEAEAQLSLSSSQIMPTLSVQADAAYGLDGSSKRYGSSDQPDFKVGLNLSGNLYDGGATIARRNSAGYAVKAAEAARETARIYAMQSLMSARSLTANMNDLLASLSVRKGLMEETGDLYRRQYIDLGTRTLLDLLNAEQELHQAQFDIVNTTHDLRRLNVDCLYETGMARKAFALEGKSVRGVNLSQ